MSETGANQSKMKDFFISYRDGIENDKRWALWIRDVLHSAGLTTIMQAVDFERTTDFIEEMHEGLKKTRGTIAILSKDYFDSIYCTKEFFNSYHEWAKGKKDLVLLKIDDFEHEGLLSNLLHYQLFPFSSDEQRATSYLLRIVEQKSNRDPGTLKFPGTDSDTSAYPGTRSVTWNLPLRNPHFTGREDVLQVIQDLLAKGDDNTYSRPVTVQGLGGIGKTEIATEYAYRRSSEYDIIWWIGAETTDTLISGYTQLLDKLDPEWKSNPDQISKRDHLRKYLETCNEKWLLIFDNAVKPEDLQSYIPRQGKGKVLITSREQVWDEIGEFVHVEMWNRHESVSFLQDRTGQDHVESAKLLADELGDYPLALAHAAAYVVNKRKTTSEYLEILKRHGLKALSRAGTVRDYRSTVAQTWLVSFGEIRSRSPESGDLLNLLAFFAPENIPVNDIQTARQFLPDKLSESLRDELAFDETLQPLISFAFLEAEGGLISMHRLVQEAVKENLSDEDCGLWAAAALKVVNDIFPFDLDNVETWEQTELVLPHALSALSSTEGDVNVLKETSRLSNSIGLYLSSRGRYEAAVVIYRRGIEACEQAFGVDSAEYAEILNDFGLTLMELGKYESAKENFEHSLLINEKSLGPDHEEVARDLNNLGEVLRRMGEYEAAKVRYEQSLEIACKVYGPDHPNVATAENNIGLVYHSMGDSESAKKNFEHALLIDEKTFGPDHPKVGIRVNNLAGIQRKSGNYEEAKTNYERALMILESALGQEHPTVATVVNNLGKVLRQLGDFDAARAACERALRIGEKVYGPDHPDVAVEAGSLGGVLEDMGDLAGARTNYERALTTFQKFLGSDHPHTIKMSRSLADLAKKMSS